MNILICDDIPEDAKLLDGLLRGSGFKADTVVFHNAYDALEFIHTGAVTDVSFIDIVMPQITGITLAQKLRESGYTGEIIFLSASNEYGSDAFSVRAFDYLLKPPTPETVNAVLSKLERYQNRADMGSILVKAGSVVRSILYRDISHVEVIQHKVYFRLTDGGEVGVKATFAEISAELLKDPRFIRCHRSYIVNMRDIAEVSETEVVTHGGAHIPVPRNYRETKNIFFKWKFKGDVK